MFSRSKFWKKDLGRTIEIHWNKYRNLDKMFIFTQLILPTSEINKLNFLRSSLNYIHKMSKVLFVKVRECLCNIYP